jgi:Rad3-related DNA helicase
MFIYGYTPVIVKYMSKTKTTIVVENTTRQLLKQLGRKDQTYDQLINELATLKQARQNKLFLGSKKTAL